MNVGDKVTAIYKTGKYIGEIVEQTSPAKVAVQILAVLQHPQQGDLHQPMQAQVAFFHQRRALAFKEIALMPVNTVKPYNGELPDYRDSLKAALGAQMESLRASGDEYSTRALQQLKDLSQDYFPQGK